MFDGWAGGIEEPDLTVAWPQITVTMNMLTLILMHQSTDNGIGVDADVRRGSDAAKHKLPPTETGWDCWVLPF